MGRSCLFFFYFFFIFLFFFGGGGGGGGAGGGGLVEVRVTSYIWHSTDVRTEWPPLQRPSFKE